MIIETDRTSDIFGEPGLMGSCYSFYCKDLDLTIVLYPRSAEEALMASHYGEPSSPGSGSYVFEQFKPYL
jgi:hypothetical protein